jgi:GPI mannosyltransferase 3
MISKIKELLNNDPRLKFILLAGLIIQVIVAYTATGSYHPDQHFQIIEFSSYQTGEPNGASALWEFYHPVRPTIQIYLFTAWHSVMQFLGINNPYTELTILRILLGLLMFTLFNAIAVYYFKNGEKKVLYCVLLILSFSWFLPYTKVQFSSEIMSALVFFGMAVWYDIKKDKNPGLAFLLLTGFLFSLAFYFRFQAGFFLAGFGIWLIGFQKKTKHLLPLATGFIIGALLNTWLDYEFYHRLVITPYEYYYVNIVDKRAAMFGTSSFLRYIGLFIAVVTVPPLSIFLFYYAIKAFFKNYRHLLFITTMVFILAHCMVGHKEERFMFPVLFILPVWIGWGLPAFFNYYSACKKVARYFIKAILIFSVAINFVVLILFIFNPYSQSIHFTEQLSSRFNNKNETKIRVYYLKRSPFETPAKSPYIFYERYFKNTDMIRVNNNDSIKFLHDSDLYIATTFDEIDGRRVIDSLGYKPVLYSSNLLWKINEFLYSRKMHSINDIWVLYKK